MFSLVGNQVGLHVDHNDSDGLSGLDSQVQVNVLLEDIKGLLGVDGSDIDSSWLSLVHKFAEDDTITYG